MGEGMGQFLMATEVLQMLKVHYADSGVWNLQQVNVYIQVSSIHIVKLVFNASRC